MRSNALASPTSSVSASSVAKFLAPLGRPAGLPECPGAKRPEAIRPMVSVAIMEAPGSQQWDALIVISTTANARLAFATFPLPCEAGEGRGGGAGENGRCRINLASVGPHPDPPPPRRG